MARLLDACGYRENPCGFFAELLILLGKADGTTRILVNGIELPHMMLMAVMEVVLPGNAFISIKNTEQLEKVANIRVPEADRADIQSVIDTYPVRLSMHTIRQMRVSGDVAYQYLPFVQELDNAGHTNTWIGQFHQGLLEQMYQNRVIFLLNMTLSGILPVLFPQTQRLAQRNQPHPGGRRKGGGARRRRRHPSKRS